ncbi:hypothetical protein TcCL_NonESM10522 [Trypanosoma cruzi]|nr:hypothetical protein TcCL_NonESM10522 [Trypanosoma cruzi]
MSDVFPPVLFAFVAPHAVPASLLCSPADCTKRGVEEEAECLMKCEGFRVDTWNTAIFFPLSVSNIWRCTIPAALRDIRNESPLRRFFIIIYLFLLNLRPFSCFSVFGNSLRLVLLFAVLNATMYLFVPLGVPLLAVQLTLPHHFFFSARGIDSPRRRSFVFPHCDGARVTGRPVECTRRGADGVRRASL